MIKLKKVILFLWDDKYLFLLCLIVAFFCWQGINKTLSNEAYVEDKKIQRDLENLISNLKS